MARIKLLRNKRQVVVRQMRRDVASLLQSGEDATARIRVEHVIREQNIMAANEMIEIFCELLVARLSIISRQRECPADLKEGISSLIFAAPRCSDIPELLAIRDIFEKKYGKDFVSAATDLRPDCGVNRILIDKLSVRTPKGEVKLKLMKEIAKEYQIEWNSTESEAELLKPAEERIEGPQTFVSAASMPLPKPSVQPTNAPTRLSGGEEEDAMHFGDSASAAEAAAESAKKAVAAAQAAAYLACKESNSKRSPSFDSNMNDIDKSIPTYYNANNHQAKVSRATYESQSFDGSTYSNNEGARPTSVEGRKVNRRHSYNVPSVHSDIKFDESESDEEEDVVMEDASGGTFPPPKRAPPPVPRIHPKLPDYDALSARFEALKFRK